MSTSQEDELAELRSLVISVYRDVWNEFYDWEEEYSKSVLESLDPGTPSAPDSTECQEDPPPLTDLASMVKNWAPSAKGRATWTDETGFVVYQGQRMEVTSCLELEIDVPVLPPCPKYESCTPALRPILHGDDPPSLDFVPFADEEEFNFEDFHEHYDSFAWQQGHEDPDHDMIVLETLHRLCAYHHLSMEEILKTSIITESAVRRLKDRDFLQWRTFPISRSDVPEINLSQEKQTLRQRLNIAIDAFCTNLNCCEPYCSSHIRPQKLGQPHNVSLEKPVAPVDEPCGKDCFILFNVNKGKNPEIDIDPSSIETISTVLSVCPELNSCQLAVFCAIPCNRVHRLRTYASLGPVIDEEGVRPSSYINTSSSPQKAPKSAKVINLDLSTTPLCRHDGPCNEHSDCVCYLSNAKCERGCSCPLTCDIRFPGCDCGSIEGHQHKPGTPACHNSSCPCLRASRECDPINCPSCKPASIKDNICRNAQIQQGRRKALVVKETEHGFGLFLYERAQAKDLIAEYAGQIVYDPTVDSRSIITGYRGRSYVFTFRESGVEPLSIDSAYVGNETRFINHSRGRAVNCIARIRIVNGELRLGIFASKYIKAGKELFFDYGPEFFKDDDDNGDNL